MLGRAITITPTFGRISQISPPGGLASIVYTYPSGQLNTVTRGDQTTRYTYDRATQLLTTIQDPRGYQTSFFYEPSAACKNRISRIEYPNLDPDQVDRYVYDTCANGVPNSGSARVMDPNLHWTTYNWDTTQPNPLPTMITDALNRQTILKYGRYTFDVSSISTMSTANPTNPLRTKTWVYDDGEVDGALQEFHNSFDGQDIVTKYYYENDRPPCINPLKLDCQFNRFLPTYVVNPEGVGTVFDYDDSGNLVGAQTGAGHWILTPRNYPNGTVRAIQRPRGETDFEYDYDGGGNLTKIKVTDPLERVSETTYDSVGRPIETTTASGKQVTFRFDSLSRLTRVTYQDGRVDLAYDANNNLVSMQDSRTGLITTFTYDPRNRLVQKSSPLDTITYTYDGVGNLTSKTDAGGTVSYDYDPVNQLTTVNDHGALVTYSICPTLDKCLEPRDENNRSHKVTYPGGMTISRDWDDGGRIKRILAQAPASEFSSGTLVDLRYEYEPNSNLLHQFTDTDGTSAEYSYDLLNQLTGETRKAGNGVTVSYRFMDL